MLNSDQSMTSMKTLMGKKKPRVRGIIVTETKTTITRIPNDEPNDEHVLFSLLGTSYTSTWNSFNLPANVVSFSFIYIK